MWYNNRNAAIVRLDRLIQRRKFGKGAISILRIWYNHTMCGENLTTKTVLQDLPGPLLAWYRANARDLPWRRTTDPYQIWVSEIMLQQTRVAAVLGYYARFLETFPTVEALAAAPEERLMKLWEGLGYYSRARNLQKAARIVAEQGGRFPDTYQDLLALPGVGDYTASAIASAAFGRREAAVDGNVLRVVMRLTDCRDDIADPKVKKAVRAQIQAVMPEAEADIRVFNQATMELGATVCAPNGPPRCLECPAMAFCKGRLRGTAEDLPVKGAKKPRRALVTAPTFAEYAAALETVGCTAERFILQAADDFAVPEAFLSAIDDRVDLVFLCQPNNPTGQLTPPDFVARILQRCTACGALLVLDECFLDFLPDHAQLTAKPLLGSGDLLILKAFTKLYGMAGVRLGYALSADTALLDAMQHTGQPWAVSSLAQAAGLAALDETAYVEQVRALIAAQRPLLASGLRALGLRVLDGRANYLLFQGPETLGETLRQKGVVLRSCANYPGLDGSWYRTAVRTAAENEQLLQTLSEVFS